MTTLSNSFAELSSAHYVVTENAGPTLMEKYPDPIRRENVVANRSLRGAVFTYTRHLPVFQRVNSFKRIQSGNCYAITGESTTSIKARGKMGKRGNMIKAYSAREAMNETELLAMTMVEAAQSIMIRRTQSVSVRGCRDMADNLMRVVQGVL